MGTSGWFGHLDSLTLDWSSSVVVPRRHVCPDATAAEEPDRLGPAAHGAAGSGPLEAGAGAARGPGYHHWAHFLLRVLSSACGLGPVTPGELQEAGVKGAVFPHPLTRPLLPAHLDHVACIPGWPSPGSCYSIPVTSSAIMTSRCLHGDNWDHMYWLCLVGSPFVTIKSI